MISAADSGESRLLYFSVPYPDDGYSWRRVSAGEKMQGRDGQSAVGAWRMSLALVRRGFLLRFLAEAVKRRSNLGCLTPVAPISPASPPAPQFAAPSKRPVWRLGR